MKGWNGKNDRDVVLVNLKISHVYIYAHFHKLLM